MIINKPFPPIVAAFALAFAFLAGPQVHAATFQGCLDEYAESNASDECDGGTSINMFVDNNDECNLADTCPKDDGTKRRTNYTGPEGDLDDLENCDGELKKDSCS